MKEQKTPRGKNQIIRLTSSKGGVSHGDDAETPFIHRVRESLQLLRSQGYETAEILELVFGVLNELLTTSAGSRFSRRRICVKALRILRTSKRKSNEADKQKVAGPYDPVALLLRRALVEFENVALRVFAADPADDTQREAIKREVGNLTLSIITAERMSGTKC